MKKNKYHGKRKFVKNVNGLNDIKKYARKNIQNSLNNGDEMIEKVIIAYESIINVENKVGLLVPYEDFEKSALENFKEYKKRISKKEINELFWKLMSAGVVFIPKKGFIQRIISKRRFDENI